MDKSWNERLNSKVKEYEGDSWGERLENRRKEEQKKEERKNK